MNMKSWLRGLGMAAVGGVTTALGGAFGATVSGSTIWSRQFWETVGGAVIFGAVTHIVAYLQKSPLPDNK